MTQPAEEFSDSMKMIQTVYHFILKRSLKIKKYFIIIMRTYFSFICESKKYYIDNGNIHKKFSKKIA